MRSNRHRRGVLPSRPAPDAADRWTTWSPSEGLHPGSCLKNGRHTVDSLDGMSSGSPPLETAKGDTMNAWLGALLAAMALTAVGRGEEPLYVARPLTQPGEFTEGIEGPGCDAKGNIYAVNFARQQTIGKVTPDGKGEVFVSCPARAPATASSSTAGIDVRRRLRAATTSCGSTRRRGRSRSSPTRPDEPAQRPGHRPRRHPVRQRPNWGNGTGQVWTHRHQGQGRRWSPPNMGTTNGIEVSPDGKTLYVNESVQRNVWAFAIRQDGRWARSG